MYYTFLSNDDGQAEMIVRRELPNDTVSLTIQNIKKNGEEQECYIELGEADIHDLIGVLFEQRKRILKEQGGKNV